MKYNTISGGSVPEGKKMTFNSFIQLHSHEKMAVSEAEVASIRGELEIVQKALKLQTKRCRQLVAEYTRRLQVKEQEYQSEKKLRDDQLAKVLRALLVFEARLKQEQKFISFQLKEKDQIIRKQRNDIKKLLDDRYCKNCNKYCSPTCNLESQDSSSDYVTTDYQDYQSSNIGSLDSSSETYASVSERDYEYIKTEGNQMKNIYTKNKNNKDSLGRRNKKLGHRKSISNYFEVLKLRSETNSPSSLEDNSKSDDSNLKTVEKSTGIKPSDRKENGERESVMNKSCESLDSDFTAVTNSDCNLTVIQNKIEKNGSSSTCSLQENERSNDSEEATSPKMVISEDIPVFDGGGETNDTWYASASDQEDDDHTDIYRNNPVLECMNQILLQNINDVINSPPKTPEMDLKFNKSGKRVKFSDESTENSSPKRISSSKGSETNYYETPIQRAPNLYETPQSIYSNDYEQILSQCSDTFPNKEKYSSENSYELQENNKNGGSNGGKDENQDSPFYIDMDTKSEKDEGNKRVVRKSKKLRTPPALPPKPTNLLSKHKITGSPTKSSSSKGSERSFDSEPDYCSISEINLPTEKSKKTICVVAEINAPPSSSSKGEAEKLFSLKTNKQTTNRHLSRSVPNLVGIKGLEKPNVQFAKQAQIINNCPPRKMEPDIPKLPQVTEIIIPDEKKDEERVSHDNYVKNNTQILNQKKDSRTPIVIGSSVSTLIADFNKRQIISDANKSKLERNKPKRRVFSSFENLSSPEKHKVPEPPELFDFSQFDLSQNFEEFKLDDCEIREEYEIEELSDISSTKSNSDLTRGEEKHLSKSMDNLQTNNSQVELVRTASNVVVPQLNENAILQLKMQLETDRKNHGGNEKHRNVPQPVIRTHEPTYEHFLECTGLSSKSILTPSRLISNHKSMLKPKDIKLRSKVKTTTIVPEKQGKNIKYWSEPYL